MYTLAAPPYDFQNSSARVCECAHEQCVEYVTNCVTRTTNEGGRQLSHSPIIGNKFRQLIWTIAKSFTYDNNKKKTTTDTEEIYIKADFVNIV